MMDDDDYNDDYWMMQWSLQGGHGWRPWRNAVGTKRRHATAALHHGHHHHHHHHLRDLLPCEDQDHNGCNNGSDTMVVLPSLIEMVHSNDSNPKWYQRRIQKTFKIFIEINISCRPTCFVLLCPQKLFLLDDFFFSQVTLHQLWSKSRHFWLDLFIISSKLFIISPNLALLSSFGLFQVVKPHLEKLQTLWKSVQKSCTICMKEAPTLYHQKHDWMNHGQDCFHYCLA